MRLGRPGAVVLSALLTGCALDYGDPKGIPADQVPQMVFSDLKQLGVRDGQVLYSVESGESEVYQTKKLMLLKNFRFQEYDSSGVAVSTGEAEAATIDTSSNDATLTGKLKARSAERGVDLEIDGGTDGSLTWSNEDRILKSGPGAAVRMSKDDGSRIDAKGLVLDLSSNRLDLEEGVQGTWTSETKQNAAQDLPPRSVSPRPHP